VAGTTITNWFGDLVSHPRVVVEALSVEDIIRILKDSGQYPSPVRAVGSNHSTAPVGVAEGGTLIQMSRMNRILEIGADTVTVQAGAIAIEIAHQLEKHGMQFYVNTEIGNLSVGSAACAGTKDASMPGEYGQVGSYITRIKMVLPSGELFEVLDEQPELIRKVRSSARADREGSGRTVETVRRSAPDLRPEEPAVERFFPRPAGRVSEGEIACYPHRGHSARTSTTS
jgi:FAD/FMN-containing dehydrogenase